MIKQPLFGQDSSPHLTSMFLSAIITLIAWIIFCFMAFFIKFKPKTPQYKEIQIVLSSEKHEQNEQSSSASAAAPMEEAIVEEIPVVPEPVEGPQDEVLQNEAPVVEEIKAPEPVVKEVPKSPSTSSGTTKPKTETPKPKTETPKPAAPKTTDPAKKINFDDLPYANDYSEGIDFNNVSTNKKKEFDWSQFEDSSSEPEPQVSQPVNKVTTQSTIGGSAAEKSQTQSQKQSSSQNKSQNTTPAASSATSDLLKNIKNSQYSTSTGKSIKAITEAKTSKGSDGSLSMAMTDGSTRVLINPIPPVIKLSDAAAALIDSTRTVTIEFKVLSSGNVPRADIIITPESILPAAVRDEIYDQLSSWLFESSASSARATFEYTIVKQ